MSKRIWSHLVLAACLVGCSSAAFPAPAMLAVSQDEGAMEKTIAAFLKDTHQVEFQVVEGKDKPGDVTLLRSVKSDKVPEFQFIVKTGVSAKDDNGKVVQRMLVLAVLSGMKVPAEKRGAALEAMNGLNDQYDFSHVYIDSDGDIASRWELNVTEVGLPAEAVYDAFESVTGAWEQVQPALAKAIGG